MSFEVRKEPIEVPVTWNGKTIVFKMKELVSDDVWEIQQQTSNIVGQGDNAVFKVDQSMRNKLFLAKCISDPPQTIETIAKMPHPVTLILINAFNSIHFPPDEELKKTLN